MRIDIDFRLFPNIQYKGDSESYTNYDHISQRMIGDYNTLPNLTVKLNTNSQVVSIKADDENAEDLFTYLSVLSDISFSGGATLFDISDYGTDAGGTNVLTMRDGTAFNRRDINMLRFNFKDLLSSVYVSPFSSNK